MKEQRRRIGFVGCPPEEVIAPLRDQILIDLDNHYPRVEQKSESMLPKTCCRIAKRILDNALSLQLDQIIFDEGYGKCDTARAVADILESILDIPILRTRNGNTGGWGTPISDSDLPLREKVGLILEDFVSPRELHLAREEHPRAAIWGVPAADLTLYELFPPGTKILGWLRCFENRTPADLELELEVDSGVPTVFFAQTFCYKNLLAQHLARKYDGLYVDMDGYLSRPIRAKVEAFLRFNGAI